MQARFHDNGLKQAAEVIYIKLIYLKTKRFKSLSSALQTRVTNHHEVRLSCPFSDAFWFHWKRSGAKW